MLSSIRSVLIFVLFLFNVQFDDARIDFGTVVNSGLSSLANVTQSSIMISFRSVVISNPTYQTNGSQFVMEFLSFFD